MCVSIAAVKVGYGSPPQSSVSAWIPCTIPEDAQIHYWENTKSTPGCDFPCWLGFCHSREEIPTALLCCSLQFGHWWWEDKPSGRDTKGQSELEKYSAGFLPTSNHTQHPWPAWFREQPHLKRARLPQLGAGEVPFGTHTSLSLCLLAFPALPSSHAPASPFPLFLTPLDLWKVLVSPIVGPKV